METADIRMQWEGAAPGWSRWEPVIASSLEQATELMLDMAGVQAGSRVLDLACGAGSQTLRAAQRVGAEGLVVANDLAEAMLLHTQENARAAGCTNVRTLAGAAEDLDLQALSFDAVICRLGLMLFGDPGKALRVAWRVLRPGGRIAVIVFTTPVANPLLAKAMQILLRHAGKTPPHPAQPGIFALGAPGLIERLFAASGFVQVERRVAPFTLRLASAGQALAMMQEAFGAYRAVLSDCPEAVRAAAWAEVAELLKTSETDTGFNAAAEVVVAAGERPA